MLGKLQKPIDKHEKIKQQSDESEEESEIKL